MIKIDKDKKEHESDKEEPEKEDDFDININEYDEKNINDQDDESCGSPDENSNDIDEFPSIIDEETSENKEDNDPVGEEFKESILYDQDSMSDENFLDDIVINDEYENLFDEDHGQEGPIKDEIMMEDIMHELEGDSEDNIKNYIDEEKIEEDVNIDLPHISKSVLKGGYFGPDRSIEFIKKTPKNIYCFGDEDFYIFQNNSFIKKNLSLNQDEYLKKLVTNPWDKNQIIGLTTWRRLINNFYDDIPEELEIFINNERIYVCDIVTTSDEIWILGNNKKLYCSNSNDMNFIEVISDIENILGVDQNIAVFGNNNIFLLNKNSVVNKVNISENLADFIRHRQDIVSILKDQIIIMGGEDSRDIVYYDLTDNIYKYELSGGFVTSLKSHPTFNNIIYAAVYNPYKDESNIMRGIIDHKLKWEVIIDINKLIELFDINIKKYEQPRFNCLEVDLNHPERIIIGSSLGVFIIAFKD